MKKVVNVEQLCADMADTCPVFMSLLAAPHVTTILDQSLPDGMGASSIIIIIIILAITIIIIMGIEPSIYQRQGVLSENKTVIKKFKKNISSLEIFNVLTYFIT